MAKVYGKTRPGQGGWAEFETEVENYLENEVDGYAVTFGMREHAEKYGRARRTTVRRRRTRAQNAGSAPPFFFPRCFSWAVWWQSLIRHSAALSFFFLYVRLSTSCSVACVLWTGT